MNGLGFLIWQLATIMKYRNPSQLVALCYQMGVSWISIKIANGQKPYNQIAGSDDILIDYLDTLRAAGIDVGGWVYTYPMPQAYPVAEAALYHERVLFLRLSHLLLDVECEWKKPGLAKQIDQICDIRHPGFPVGLCSYRYPNFHPGIDWKTWLKQPEITFSAPQVYWEQAHNPAYQLRKSYDQYRKLTNKPYYPIGSSYGAGAWQPTPQDLVTFIETARAMNCGAYGFYSLDWILKHNKIDWIDAISSTKEAA